MCYLYVFLSILVFSAPTWATDWSKDAKLPGKQICKDLHGRTICLSNGNRKNILAADEATLTKLIHNGGEHVLDYPVDVTRMRLPKAAMDKLFNSDSNSALRRFIFRIARRLTSFKDWNDIFTWLGLHEFPKTQNELGPNFIPNMGELEEYPMGVSRFRINGHESLSFSCAACHSSDLFGVKVLGLTNRFPRANEAFILGKKLLSKTPASMFKLLVGPSNEDYKVFKEAKSAMKYVGVKKPIALGLDTSLAQVGMSLDKRQKDAYANLKPRRRTRGQKPYPLASIPADSKPAVWWNLKYKTKWLSDGSIVSGNPVHTNFLWNEIGRGVDLRELEGWLTKEKKKVQELTAYVFNTEAPLFNDFFPNRIDIAKAKRGEKIYLNNCFGCHGKYEKGWSSENHEALSYEEKLTTTQVWYHTKTKVVDVSTDPYRHEGMKYFYKDLNRLQISKTIGTVVTPQKGYVPPPLVGIWARWPYMHNNSIPSLYQVLTPDFKRTKFYVAVPADDRYVDFDLEKNGYPAPEQVRAPYNNDPEYFFDNTKRGMSNQGHTKKMLLNEDGSEKFDHQQKLELIEFLKTL